MNAKGKTLKELNALPGDKVRCVDGKGNASTGDEYTVNGYGDILDCGAGKTNLSKFILISRAKYHNAASLAKIAGIKLTDNGAEVQSETHDFGGHQPADEDAPRRIKDDSTIPVFVREGYDSLFNALCRALHQAQDGKGKERHAGDKPFIDQPIMGIGDLVGMGFQTGQAIKKTVEAHGMVNRNQLDAAERELLGAINYLAAAVLRINQIATAQTKEN